MHTETPWDCEEQFLPEDLGESNGCFIINNGIPIALVYTGKDDMERIKLAVNACEGIPDDQLTPGLVSRLKYKVKSLEEDIRADYWPQA